MESRKIQIALPLMHEEGGGGSLKARIKAIKAGPVPEVQVIQIGRHKHPVCIGCGEVMYERGPNAMWCRECEKIAKRIPYGGVMTCPIQ